MPAQITGEHSAHLLDRLNGEMKKKDDIWKTNLVSRSIKKKNSKKIFSL